MNESTLELSNIKLTIYGASHAEKIGVKIEGLPEGERIDTGALQTFLERRAPGRAKFATPRKEPDAVVFEEGVTDGVITGTVHGVIYNTNTRSGDYDNLKRVPRPAHADYPAMVKYGEDYDPRGGGHFSARMTAPLCIAGGICKELLRAKGIEIGAHIARIRDISDTPFDPIDPDLTILPSFPTVSEEAAEKMQDVIEAARLRADSVGGIIECAVKGLPVGIGEHMFYGLENTISRVIFGIPAVKGIEFGAGFGVADLFGSENNDPYYYEGDTVKTRTNNHGGILGGMSTGMPLLFRVALKPTPSIGIPQESVNISEKSSESITVGGRHDPCVLPRAVPIVEAAAAIAIYDAIKVN
ncbi:MAG: chorismate synthase [Clostridia bacterium]|nr:chorismate synthase [Clostridia bacterium]